MKKRNSKSKDILLENCEDVPIEDSETILPSEIGATANLLHQNSINTTAEVDDSAYAQIKSESSTLTQETQIDIEVPLSAEKARKSLASIANEPSIFKYPPLPWYRNWTNAGIVLCVVYNLVIVFLLVMGVMKFGRG